MTSLILTSILQRLHAALRYFIFENKDKLLIPTLNQAHYDVLLLYLIAKTRMLWRDYIAIKPEIPWRLAKHAGLSIVKQCNETS